MSNTSLTRFWRDQRGAGTVWGLLWFILFVGICGLAVDITNGFRARTMLQSTADSTALAAAVDLPDTSAAVATAVAYSTDNMTTDIYGNVLTPDDVTVGRWDGPTHSLDTMAPDPDAVMVRVYQAHDNSNPLQVNFLRIIGLMSWDVTAQAVAQRFIPKCLNNGLVAREMVDMSSNNAFTNNICVHGNEGVNIQSNNFFESGVSVSMPKLSMLEVGGSGMQSNPGLQQALREDILNPRDVDHTDEIMASYLTPETAPFLPSYITARKNSDVIELKAANFDWANVKQGYIHHVTCKNDQQPLNVPAGYLLQNVVIIADCQVQFGANSVVFDSVIGSRANMDLKAAANPKQAREGADLSTAAGVQFGKPDNCAIGGGVQLYSNGSMHFSSTTGFDGVQIVAAGDVHLGARDMGINGISVQSGGTIYMESNNMFGLCAGGVPNAFWMKYYRLVL